MKKMYTSSLFILISLIIFSQTPQSFNYQAVVRDVSGTVLSDQKVGVQVSVLQTSTTGTAIYIERFTPTTNEFGLLTLNIGNGAVQSGVFENIDWEAGPYFLKMEIDQSGGTTYSHIGTSQLLSVPYALYAKTSGSSNMWLKNTFDELYYLDGFIGIGTNNPRYHLDIWKATGEAYLRIKSDEGSSSLIIDKPYSGMLGQVVYQEAGVNKFFAGLLSNNNYRISTERYSLNGLEVQESGDVRLSNGLIMSTGASEGKVLTSDASGNASWQGGPTTKYLSIPAIAFVNNKQVSEPTDNSSGFVIAVGEPQAVHLECPVYLPEGATITGMRISVFDNEAALDFYVGLHYIERSSVPSGGDEFIVARSSGAADTGRDFNADLSGVDPWDLIIYQDRAYYIKAIWNSGSNNLYMALSKVLISYIE